MSDPFGTPPRTSASASNEACAPILQSSTHDDDLLDLLLNYSTVDIDPSTTEAAAANNGEVYKKLQEMQSRFLSDLGANAVWWEGMRSNLEGFRAVVDTDDLFSDCANLGGGSGGSGGTPTAFQSPGGQLHLRTLMDACDIDSERAVHLTFATLTSMLQEGENSTSSSSTAADDDDASSPNSSDERVESLLNHLGSRQLFDECVSRYKMQFVERVRILCECLRIDQEVRAAGDDDGDGDIHPLGKEISRFLSDIDTRFIMNKKKRGLFHFLLRLAVAPLPQVFQDSTTTTASAVHPQLTGFSKPKSEDALIAPSIRKEAMEGLLILLYDRLDGGVSRCDLMMLLLGASSSSCDTAVAGLEYMEFAMPSSQYVQSGMLNRSSKMNFSLSRDDFLFSKESTIMTSLHQLILSLNGLWGLLCAECMGLWRTNSQDWIADHPLFAGLHNPTMSIETDTASTMRGVVDNTPNLDLTGRGLGMAVQQDSDGTSTQSQKELGLLYAKLISVGGALRDRRRVAYKSRKNISGIDAEETNYDDDELWGVHAPEGVALLSFGLLLQLVRFGNSETGEFAAKLSKWGSECARMANDDCAAFAYLERVLDGVVVDPLDGVREKLSLRLGSGRGAGAEIVKVLAGRREITMLADNESMALMDEDGACDDDENEDFVDGLAVDASSVVYSSIGREILASTIRVFKQSLLSLQSSSAVDNIGMLVDLAAIIYRHSTPLCDQFWSDWNEFSTAMTDEGAAPSSSDESMCFLLETAHNLAQSTLNELSNGGRQEAIMKYIRPMSSFLHLISSLCSSSAVLHNVLDSGFLPDGLVSKTVSICHALAPMASQLNESIEPVTSDDRRTIQYATIALESIATIAYLGGQPAREWLRNSLAGAGQPRMLFTIASNARPQKNGGVTQECVDLASSGLNLLSELLVGSSVSFHIDAIECFASSKTFANRAHSAFSYFLSGGIQSKVSLSAVSVLSSLAANLDQNAFDEHVNPRSIVAYIETLRDGIKTGLEVLSSLFSGGEVLPLTSHTQVDVAYSVMLSTVATLIGVRSVMYLHKDINVRLIARTVRDEIVDLLASSTALGQVVGYLSTSSITPSKIACVGELAPVRESPNEDNKYGAWARFVTPKRASQKSSQREAKKEANSGKGVEVPGGEDSSLFGISEIALSLILIWGSHVEDMFCGKIYNEVDENFINCSPYNLLLSKVPYTSAHDAPQMNVSILNMISQYEGVENENHLPYLSAKIIKMCISQASAAAQCSGADQMVLAGIPSAFAGGIPTLSQSVIRSLKKVFATDSFCVGMEQSSALVTINLESIALAVSKQPELARSLLVGKKDDKDFKFVDELVSAIESTVSILNSMNQKKSFDSRLLRLRCAVAISCLEVILELWKCCRLGALNRHEYHACGGIVGHLASEDNSPLMANLVVELAQSSLFAIVSIDEKESLEDEVPISSVNEKSVILRLLSNSLGFLAIETVSRIQTNKGISFISDLINSGPVKCFISLLTSNTAPVLAATAWVETKLTKSLHAFFEVCPTESSFGSCSLDLAIHYSRVASKEASISRWNALNNLASAVTCYAKEFAAFFEAVNLAPGRPAADVMALTSPLLDGVIAALSSISEAHLSSRSLLPDDITMRTLTPFSELSSLLLASLSTRGKLEKANGKSLLQMLLNLHESSSRIFILTQSCSDDCAKEACSIRQKLLCSALILLLEYQSLPDKDRPRSESIGYGEARLGWLDITLNAIQALQFSDASQDVSMSNSHFLFNFGNEAKSNTIQAERCLAFELLEASYSMLAALAPTVEEVDIESKSVEALSYDYSGDFSTCMKQRSAISYIQNHLADASTVASLTYHAIYNGTVTRDLSSIHTNAISIVDKITTFILTLAYSSGTMVDILTLLMDSRVIRSFQENPLLKLCKMWTGDESSQGNMLPVMRNRGYVPAASGHSRMEHQTDSVHWIWCKVIKIFSAILRSARLQSEVYANIDGSVHQLLPLIESASLDFVCAFHETIFSCFSSMDSKPELQQEKKAQKGSSIPSAPFSFTVNLLTEAACIAYLFEQLCIGEAKNKFALSYGEIYKNMNSVMLEAAKMLSSFLGSIGNARELFSVLSSASSLSYDQHSSIIDSHPLLADGIPNARHESIRSSHYASSCCRVVTKDEYNQSHSSARGVAESSTEEEKLSSDAHLQQTFQIQVNNKFIDHLEHTAGQCMFSVLSILTNTHPASDSFVSFTHEEIRRLDVAAVLRPGTRVAVAKGSESSYYNSSRSKTVEVGHCKACDRSTRTLLVQFSDKNGIIEKQVPWSLVSGMEDTSRRQRILSHHAAAKSAGDLDKEPTSIGHLIIVLRWSRHISEGSPIHSVSNRIADRASILLSTELGLHDELNQLGTADEERKINAQLLDLFEDVQNKDSDETTERMAKLIVDEGILASVRLQLRSRLHAASSERDEEMKLWEQQNAGWDSSFWGGSNKREGRRSPFRAFNRMSSMDSSQ